MKKVCLDLGECNGLGDIISSTPTIMKLSKAYGTPIVVLSKMPELFKNNRYVSKSYKKSSVNMDYFIDSGYIIHNSFYNVGKKDENGIEYKHNVIDIRQFHAINLGFMLLEEEKECFYLPTFPRSIPMPERPYFVIHPVQTWGSRSWSEDEWLNLSSEIISLGYDVVAIGKESSETGFFNVQKPTYNLGDSQVIDYLNKTNISDAWYLIKDSLGIITMDSGMLHLAGTTEAYIFHLGSSINPEYRRPYRSRANHKYIYIHGKCHKFCASDMGYGVKEWGNIQGVPPLIGCLEGYTKFECHPSYQDVLTNIKRIYNV
jgi:ADP-heptose:LPS heptosyltransferase